MSDIKQPAMLNLKEKQLSAEARVGAKWWADKLRTGFVPDNGDRSATGSTVSLYALLLRDKETAGLTAGMVDQFEAALAPRIERYVEEMPGFGFGTDYGPDKILADALEDAGIKPGMTVLPWKTMMWAKPGSVSVGDGYGASPVELPLEVCNAAR